MVSYTGKTNDELKAELIKRGFDESEIKDLKKADLIAALESDDKGEFDEEGIADAEAAVAVDPGSDEEAPSDVSFEPAPAVADSKDAIDIVRIVGSDTHYIRTFTKDIHGKDYKAMASGYVQKEGRDDHFMIDSGKITEVIVRYRENKKQLDGSRKKVICNTVFGGSVPKKMDAVTLANSKRSNQDSAVIIIPKAVKIDREKDLSR